MADEDKKVKFVEAEAVEAESTATTKPTGTRKTNKFNKKKGYHHNTYSRKATSSQYTSKTEEIKTDTFGIGPNMGKKWMTSREAFINYAARTYGGSVKASLHKNKLTMLNVDKPKEYTTEEYDKLTALDLEIWKMDYKRYRDKQDKVRDSLVKLYDTLWDQCESTMKNKIKAQPQYTVTMEESDVIGLLNIIDFICINNDTTKCYELQSFFAEKKILNFRQRDDQEAGDYFKEFEMLLRVAEQTGTNFATPQRCEHTAQAVYQRTLSELNETERLDVKERTRERYIAMVFMMNSNKAKYGKYKEECHNSFAQKDDKYPKTLVDALTVLEQYRFNPVFYRSGNDRTKANSNESMTQASHSFYQDANDPDERNSNSNNQSRNIESNSNTDSNSNVITCFNCGREGHISPNCTFTHKENGDLTPKEYKKRKAEQQKEHAKNEIDKIATGTACVVTDDKIDSWSDNLTADDYDLCFLQQSPIQMKEIIIEDLTNNQKAVLNSVEGRLNPFWVLLDNQSTVHVFFNTLFLRNIRQTHKELHLYTNAGKSIINEIGELPGFGTVWVHRQGIANILSFHGVRKKKGYEITYDSQVSDTFNVYKPDGSARHFIPSKKGLYYSDFSNSFKKHNLRITNGGETVLQNDGKIISTVEENKMKYSKQDIKRAERARAFQHIAGHLSEEQLMRIARKHQLKNSPIIPRDVQLMKAILGPSIPGIKGKTIRKGKPSVTTELIPLPAHVKEHYQDLTVAMDVMHINGVPFLTTTTRHIHYHTASALPTMQDVNIVNAIQALQKFYKKRHFEIRHILADGQFQSCTHNIASLGIDLNCVSRDEHVPEAERLNRTIKERCRCNAHMVPFKKIPKRMIIGLVKNVVFYLNAFPHPDGVSTDLSPYTIVNGRVLDYNLHFTVPFGAYALTREPTDNTLKTRATGAIALGPNTNMQGGITFFSLTTGRELHRSINDFTLAPFPADAIKRVEAMASNSPEGITFNDRNNNPIVETPEYAHDTNHDRIVVITPTEPHDTNETNHAAPIQQQLTGVNTNNTEETNDENTLNDDNNDNNNDDAIEDTHHDIEQEPLDTFAEEQLLPAPGNTNEPDTDNENENNNENEPMNNENNDNDANETIEITGVTDEIQHEPRRSNRLRNTGNYTKPMNNQFEFQYFQRGHIANEEEQITRITTQNEYNNYIDALEYINQTIHRDQTINDLVLTQYSLKSGLRKFGEDGRKATIKELKQMLTRKVFSEINYDSLSEEDRRQALPILLFLTMKRDGKTVKGRACADGRKQKLWTPKHESASPTVAIEALFFTLIIDAQERRDVATCDLPGHFLQTDMEGELILRLDGPLALLLAKIDRKRWKQHVKIEKNRPVIYVRCDKAIYGTVTAALLSYKKLIGHLDEWGFEMNPYEPCCWNKRIEGSQCTVVFHVDDMKISHKDPKVVTRLITLLESVYAKEDPMTITRGPSHHYLGMTIKFEGNGEVKITMYDYIQKMIDELPKDMIGHKDTSAPIHLFQTDQTNTTKLSPEVSDIFHSITAQTLWMSRRGRPDLQLATAFLSTRVKAPDIHDYKKLQHLMKYLQKTAHLPLILRADGKGTSLYIDGAHAVHADMKGHGGLYATMGSGALYASSTKSKINTLSSTETEMVSVGEKLPKHLWLRQFAVEQTGDDSQIHVLYQDNKSTILLQNNGRLSCRKGSKHIHVRYFFITDRIKNKEIEVRYCPTEKMIADFFTKPLQGGMFKRFRNMILGIKEEHMEQYKQDYIEAMKTFGLNDSNKSLPFDPQECVGNQ